MPKTKSLPAIHPQDIERLAMRYFAECEENKEPMTLTGLALAMGFSSRQAFLAYAKKAPENADSTLAEEAQRALLRVEAEYEKALRGGSATGPIFALKSLGWSEKPEQESPAATPQTVIVRWQQEEKEQTFAEQTCEQINVPEKNTKKTAKKLTEKAEKKR